MRVREIMNPHVITIQSSETIYQALKEFARHQIHHLPVIENGKLVGIVSSHDLCKAYLSNLDSDSLERDELDRPVADIMSRNIIRIHPLDFIDEAALFLSDNKIGCLLVMEEEEMVGIVTGLDLLELIAKGITPYY